MTPAVAPRRWTLTYGARPWTLNAERRLDFHVHGRMTSEWRTAFGWLARQQKIPRLGRVAISANPSMRPPLADTGNCYGAVKAAIDGLVDAGVLRGDGPEIVALIALYAPVRGIDALTLIVEER